jgi:repressor LexA
VLGKLIFYDSKKAPFMNGLSARQEEVLLYLIEFHKTRGYPPSLREIGTHLHIAASSVLDHLTSLEKKGYIRRLRSRPRCLEVLKVPGSEKPA